MLQETVERVAPLIPVDQVYVVTSWEYRDPNIIAEPIGRGTAASIGLAAALIAAREPEAIMASFHSDHAIADVPRFRTAISFAEEIAR
jgi:mannose-1-phosphate guanylyltransferase